jgi:hypothetical protein
VIGVLERKWEKAVGACFIVLSQCHRRWTGEYKFLLKVLYFLIEIRNGYLQNTSKNVAALSGLSNCGSGDNGGGGGGLGGGGNDR